MSASIGQAPTRRLFASYWEQDGRQRELMVARISFPLALVCAGAVVLMGPRIGWGLAAGIAGFLCALALYYAVVGRLLRRGRYYRWMPVVHVTLEVSVPAVVFVLDQMRHGPTYALTAPPVVMWAALVMVSGVRGRPALSLWAGGLAAAELLVLYFAWSLPHLEPSHPPTLDAPFILFRALLLAGAGALTAGMARYLRDKAEEALRLIRERDFFGKYLLHERVGAGGMAEVFRATYCPEGGFEKEVALKRILPAYAADPDFMGLFRREAYLCSRLQHRGIVQVFDFGRHQDTWFLAMEFIDGMPLSRVLQSGSLPAAAVAWLGLELADALDYLNGVAAVDGQRLRLIHRDLNPPNVLVSRHGEVKLSDFGVARSATHRMTAPKMVRGKAGYMSPEQIAGEEIDHRTDLFALGVTLYECLTGVPAFEGPSVTELVMANLERSLPAIQTLHPEVPEALASVVMELVERTPARRIQSAAEVRRRLLPVVEQGAGSLEAQRLLAQAVAHARLTPQGRSAEELAQTQVSEHHLPSEPTRPLRRRNLGS